MTGLTTGRAEVIHSRVLREVFDAQARLKAADHGQQFGSIAEGAACLALHASGWSMALCDITWPFINVPKFGSDRENLIQATAMLLMAIESHDLERLNCAANELEPPYSSLSRGITP